MKISGDVQIGNLHSPLIRHKRWLAKGDKMTLVKTMKIKLPPGSPSPSEVARTLGATAAEVRSVDRLLDQLVPGSNGVSGRFVAKKSKAAKSKTRRTAQKRSH